MLMEPRDELNSCLLDYIKVDCLFMKPSATTRELMTMIPTAT